MSLQDEPHQGNIPDLNFYVVLLSGDPFDTTKPVNRAVSNIICSLVYGCRFEYDDPDFTSLVDRTNKFLQVGGSPSIQVRRDLPTPLTLPMIHQSWCSQSIPGGLLFQIFNVFPWVRALTANKRVFDKLFFDNKALNFHLFGRLKETLNPQLPRGFVDAFMVREQNLGVGTSRRSVSLPHSVLTQTDHVSPWRLVEKKTQNDCRGIEVPWLETSSSLIVGLNQQ